MERARFERLFGAVWQAALDHAGVLSRRRLREIGAGDGAPETLEALVEFLEAVPPELWPERWRPLGKVGSLCPTLTMPGASERLIDGRIARQDAVLLWDDIVPGAAPVWPRAGDETAPTRPILNLTVGLYWRGVFEGLPRDAPERTRWTLWQRQWQNFHGLPVVSGVLATEGASPEGMVAQWIDRRGLAGDDLEEVLSTLEFRIAPFSRRRVDELVEALRRAADDDEGAA